MSEQINDGGPAFPSKANNTDKFEGMSLRDWFAGQALAGILASPNTIKINDEPIGSANEYADVAYGVADVMLERRKK